MNSDASDLSLAARMAKLGINDEDLVEQFVRGTGPGGQKINKTSSTVLLKHLPSGIEVRCQRGRSQAANREWARTELCEKLEAAQQQVALDQQNAREKVRRQKRPRPRGVKEQLLKSKHHRSDTKKNRGRVSERER